MHEVVYTEKTKEIKNKRVEDGKVPWRVSSTLFGHIRYDISLEPLDQFKNEESIKNYPPMTVYE